MFDRDLFLDRSTTENPQWDQFVNSNPYAETRDLGQEMTDELDAVLNTERPPTQD